VNNLCNQDDNYTQYGALNHPKFSYHTRLQRVDAKILSKISVIFT
jgi:hypothetical protein